MPVVRHLLRDGCDLRHVHAHFVHQDYAIPMCFQHWWYVHNTTLSIPVWGGWLDKLSLNSLGIPLLGCLTNHSLCHQTLVRVLVAPLLAAKSPMGSVSLHLTPVRVSVAQSEYLNPSWLTAKAALKSNGGAPPIAPSPCTWHHAGVWSTLWLLWSVHNLHICISGRLSRCCFRSGRSGCWSIFTAPSIG